MLQCQNRLNTLEVLDKYKILLDNKTMMNIPLCHLLTMSVVRPTLNIVMLKMEQTFFIAYQEGERCRNLSLRLATKVRACQGAGQE